MQFSMMHWKDLDQTLKACGSLRKRRCVLKNEPFLPPELMQTIFFRRGQ
jgi:hypothetical protein